MRSFCNLAAARRTERNIAMIRTMPKKADLRGNVKPRTTLGSEARWRDNSSNAVKARATLRIAQRFPLDWRDCLKNSQRLTAAGRAPTSVILRIRACWTFLSGNPLRPVSADSADLSGDAGSGNGSTADEHLNGPPPSPCIILRVVPRNPCFFHASPTPFAFVVARHGQGC